MNKDWQYKQVYAMFYEEGLINYGMPVITVRYNRSFIKNPFSCVNCVKSYLFDRCQHFMQSIPHLL